MVVSLDNPRGLISANLICRKAVFDRLGGFSPKFQRVKDGIGSLEDDEWIRRFWKSGGRALYVPELVATTDVPSSRMTRAYHRRWHRGHGRFYARLRADEFERTSRGVAFGVPAHVYRSALRHGVAWLRSLAAGRGDQAFEHEVQLRFLAGFLAERLRELRRPALVEVK
jgi:GT2 family glycosyltransferase